MSVQTQSRASALVFESQARVLLILAHIVVPTALYGIGEKSEIPSAACARIFSHRTVVLPTKVLICFSVIVLFCFWGQRIIYRFRRIFCIFYFVSFPLPGIFALENDCHGLCDIINPLIRLIGCNHGWIMSWFNVLT